MSNLLCLLFIFLLVIACSNLVLCHSVVVSLPGFEGPLPFELETGYVGVDEAEDVQLFYYFVKSESNPKEDPLVLWLTGGPGCSVFSAFIYELGNEAGIKPLINLKGYLLGNPLTNLDDDNYRIPFAHGMGLISDELYESLQRSCQGEYSNIHPSNARCLQDYQAYSQCIDGLYKDQILEPDCGFDSPKPQELFSERRFVNEKYIKLLVHQLSPCDFSRINAYKLSHLWLDNDRVREALHIRKGSIQEWIRCNYGLPYAKSILDSFQYHVNLSTKGYRSLIYSGDHDIGVPFLGTQAWIRALNYSIVDEWRSWWVQGQVAGYTRTYSNRMTFATVKGGGHITPEYRPVECYAMFKRWISNQPL